MLYGFYQLWSAWRESTLARQLEQTGIPAQAEITDRWSARGRFSAATYYIIFSFRVSDLADAETYEQQQQVSPKNYETLEVGSQPTVKYLADDPQKSARMAGDFADKTGFSSKLISGVILVVLTSIMLVVSLVTR